MRSRGGREREGSVRKSVKEEAWTKTSVREVEERKFRMREKEKLA